MIATRNALLVLSSAALLLGVGAALVLGFPVALIIQSPHRSEVSLLTIATILATLLGLLAIIVGAAAWLLGLYTTAKERQWQWFAITLIFGPLGSLVYVLLTTRDPLGQSSPKRRA
jgi:MFS family permease